jgi:hypothetical protein
MKIILDDGTEIKSDSVTLIWEDQLVPGENENGELHIKATSEGLVSDVWVSREQSLDHNLATAWRTTDDIIETLVENHSD